MFWLLNVLLIALSMLAAIGALAAYRSPQIEGPAVVNSMRAVKSGVWGIVVLSLTVKAFAYGDPPMMGVGLLVLLVLAFCDAVSYLDRIYELARAEGMIAHQ
jgi:hypothetical protein